MAKKAVRKRKPGGGRKRRTPGGTSTYTIRHQLEVIEVAREKHPDLQQKAREWLEKMAKN